jgi:hypothetical protein
MKYNFNFLTEEENNLLYSVLTGSMDMLSDEIESMLVDVKESQILFDKLVGLHEKIEIEESGEKKK